MRGGIWETSDDSLSLDKSIVSLWPDPNILTSLSGQLGQGPGRYGRQRGWRTYPSLLNICTQAEYSPYQVMPGECILRARPVNVSNTLNFDKSLTTNAIFTERC